MRHISTYFLFSMFCLYSSVTMANNREKYNFNSSWNLHIGDLQGAEAVGFPDSDWESVALPRAFNEDEAFKVNIRELTDTVVWYRKHFGLPEGSGDKKIFVEFEGVRQGADFYINGKHIGLHENGVMAVGFDLTPHINYGGDNVVAVRVDNSWNYRERATNTKHQWNDSNFNANYGGIPKNVWLHITGKLYQTLPLYSNLETTGVYIYARNIDVKNRKAAIHAESQIRNEHKKKMNVRYEVSIYDRDGSLKKTFTGDETTVLPGETKTVKAAAELEELHFWSWGYGYLYDVRTCLIAGDKVVDEISTKTGFRKTRFAEGKIWLNDRVIQMKGYAQRTSNEWPGVGMSVPPWMSDYSNGMMVKGNANLVRWMHITPWKQDVESCDRVGLMQAMPAGDSERDVEGRRWEQRLELMRDAIIYNRNNPSIIFYESGNESISREHMMEMKAIRDRYDPHGGRATGSREMLDIREAEWGGEMLYINKSMHHPMWATEYCRDEALRKYWDEHSYPRHKEGAGPLYKGQDAGAYNRNQDMFAIEHIQRWYDYWRERPGTGRRVSAGGAKIIFSDTQTHMRGEENYRRSGTVDPLRIPKDSYFVHQVMWDGWVDTENPRTYIIGHWNYTEGTVKPVYVASNGDKVELFVNGKSKGFGRQEYRFLFTFDNVTWESGKIEAVSYNEAGRETGRNALSTAGEPANVKCSLIQSPEGWFADGAHLVIVEVEVTDANGARCPLANNMIDFTLDGPAEWRGGVAQADDNYALAKTLPVECGITRVIIRSDKVAGEVTLTARAEGLTPSKLTFASTPVEVKKGLSTFIPGSQLVGRLDRGETPGPPSYVDTKVDVAILSAVAGANPQDTGNSFDDNELSEWKNDGKLQTAWITYQLDRVAQIDDICIKLTGWRMRSYPLEVFAGDELIWSGDTEKSLGYIHLNVKPVHADKITIRLKGASSDSDAFNQIIEVAEPVANELDLFKAKDGDKTNAELRIVEVEFLETLNARTTYDFPKLKREKLNRSLVAIRKDGKSNTLSWRYKSSDPLTSGFNIYRNGLKLNEEPITNATFFEDLTYDGERAVYRLTAVNNNIETPEAEVTLQPDAPVGYLNIPIDLPPGGTTPDGTPYTYSANDASIGDVDGDGEYEIILKWAPTNSRDNAHKGYSGNTLIDCYKLNGAKLWRIDLGRNIRSGAHYTQFMVYDLDGDEKAEVVMKTADGTIDGNGIAIGDANADYRNQDGYILTGPEFLTVFNGMTGEAMATTEYTPARGDVSGWGDRRGNRVDRFLACVAYLDGEYPSVVVCRGYYTRTVLAAYDWRNGKLTCRWVFDSDNPGYSDYAGQGNHNLRTGDVDGDGCDEIIYGSCAIDHDGKGLYSTKLGHGDAMHLTAFIPGSTRMQVWDCHENKREGSTFRDAATGEILFQVKAAADVGRCMAADIDPNNEGLEMWSTHSDGIRNYKGEVVYTSQRGVPVNMACWWDGDLLRELLDKVHISKYIPETGNCDVLFSADECIWNNGTKANPCLQADILGDWREEVIWRTKDNNNLRIYVSTTPTDYRFHTFLEDPVYRMSIATQNVAYNQPTQTGFYFGADLGNCFPDKEIEMLSDSVVLDAGHDYDSYEWSTGKGDRRLQLTTKDIPANKRTRVDLKVTYRGCVFTDYVYVTLKPE